MRLIWTMAVVVAFPGCGDSGTQENNNQNQNNTGCGNGEIDPGEECDDGECEAGETVATCPADCGFSSLSAGVLHTCAAVGSGTGRCWGWNSNGKLGDGTNTDSNVPVQVSGF